MRNFLVIPGRGLYLQIDQLVMQIGTKLEESGKLETREISTGGSGSAICKTGMSDRPERDCSCEEQAAIGEFIEEFEDRD